MSTHGNHGSHSQHVNNVTRTNWDNQGSHSVSFSAQGAFANDKLDGSLKTLTTAMNTIRASMQSPNTLESVPSEEKISRTTASRLVSNTNGLASRKYRWGTVNLNFKVGSAHENSTVSNTETTVMPAKNVHLNSPSSHHADTTGTYFTSPIYEKSYSSSFTPSSGKVTKEQRDSIKAAMNKGGGKISSSVPSMTWSITGHASHSNY